MLTLLLPVSYIEVLNCILKLCSFPGVSHRHLSDHLSELVENTLTDLEHSKVSQQLHENKFEGS